MDHATYTNLLDKYKKNTKNLHLLPYLLAAIVALLILNKYWRTELGGLQLFLLLLSFLFSGGALVLQYHYWQLLQDPASELYKGEKLVVASSRTFDQRIAKHRKTVYNIHTLFWLSCLFFALALLTWLLRPRTYVDSNSGSSRQKNPIDDGKLALSIVQVNDVYEIAGLNKNTIGGMARIAALKQMCSEKNSNTLLVMAGDFVSPSVFNGIKNDTLPAGGMQMIEAMNAADFDLAVFGNHEFDIGEKQLQRCIDESSFDWVSATAFKNGATPIPFNKNGKDIPQTWIKHMSDEDGTQVRIGFLGITINDNKAPYVTYDTGFAHISKLYSQLKASCDAVIAITHQDMNNDILLAQKLPGLAAIIGGHEHDFQFRKLGSVVISKAHANARSAFILDFIIDKPSKTTLLTPRLQYLDGTVKKDALTDAVVQKWSALALNYFTASGFSPDAVVYRDGTLDGRDTDVRSNRKNVLADIVVKAMEAACPNASIAVFNAGAIRVDDMLPPPTTQFDILRALPYPGTIQEANIRGDMLVRMFNIGLQNKNEGSFLQYSPTVQQKGAQWYIGAEQIDPAAYYRVALAQYLAEGKGKNLEFLKNVQLIEPKTFGPVDIRSDVRLAVIDWLRKRKN